MYEQQARAVLERHEVGSKARRRVVVAAVGAAVKVADEEVKKNDLESTIKLMRGNEEVGSEVKVTVKRIVDSKEKIF